MSDIKQDIESFVQTHMPIRTWEAGKDWVQYSGTWYDNKEYEAVISSLMKGWFGAGQSVLRFEYEFSKCFNKGHGIFTNSGSSANLLMLSALASKNGYNFRAGTKILCPIAGFPTTINPIYQTGFTPVFVDIELETLNINTEQAHDIVDRDVDIRALIFAYALGNCPDMGKVLEIVKQYDLIFMEDCCDALGSSYNGHQLGSYGEMASCSFAPAHHISTGTGGMVTCKDEKIEKVLRSLASWGRSCFTESAPVSTKYGIVKISEIEVGDYVYTHLGNYKKVYDVLSRLYIGDLYTLKIKGGSDIKCTSEHPFYILRGGEYLWIEAKDLKEGDWFLQKVSSEILDQLTGHLSLDKEYECYSFISSTKEFVENLPVYNLEVEDDHSYHVYGVAAHNCYCSGKATLLADGTCGCRFSNWIPEMPEEIFDHKYIYGEIGYNVVPLELQAAIGRVQLSKLPEIIKIRNENYERLYKVFEPYQDIFMLHKAQKNAFVSWFAFPVTLRDNVKFKRHELCQYFEAHKIQTRPYFGGNLMLQPAYRGKMSNEEAMKYPVANKVMKDTFFLGVSPMVTKEMIDYIEEVLKTFIH